MIKKEIFGQLIGGTNNLIDGGLAIESIAAKKPRLLIIGETGSGKSSLARYLHDLAVRHGGERGKQDKKLCTIDLGTVPPNLAESELFGVEKGAFTGAWKKRKGPLERAGEGTLFLDEVHNAPREVQAKLLTAIENRRFWRVGSDEDEPLVLKAWIISASTSPEKIIPELYHRLAEFTINLRPLAGQSKLIKTLAFECAKEIQQQRKWITKKAISDEALDWLCSREWPGNLRELVSFIKAASYLAQPNLGITVRNLESAVLFHSQPEKHSQVTFEHNSATASESPADNHDRILKADPTGCLIAKHCSDWQLILKELFEHPETDLSKIPREEEIRAIIAKAILEKCNGNMAAASRILDIDVKTLRSRLSP